MSQTRLCRDSTRESERNGSVYTNSKGQISLAKGYMHKDAKSLSLKLASTSLPKKEHWLLNGKSQQSNDLESNESHNFGGGRLDVSNHSYKKSDEKLVSAKKKMSGSILSEKSVHEKINFSLHLPMSNSSHSMESSDLSQSVDNESLKLTDSGFVDDTDDKNKMSDKKSKGKRKKNVTKKTVCTSLQLNNNNDETGEDINGNPVNSNQSPVYNHPDVSQIDSLQKEMGKELAYKQALKPTESQETSGSKLRKNRKESNYVLAEDIPDYHGRDKIEDILKFIGKNPSHENLNKSLERKKKSKRKGLNGHILRSGIGSMDAKSELSDSESTNLCPTKSPSSFLDKEYCNCNASEIDSCQDDDSCLADDSFVSSPGNSAPPSEPFILVEKKNKKKVYLNSSSNNPRANRYLSSKSPFRNRKLNSAMAHAHHPHHEFDCDSKTELDSSFPDLESSYHKMRRNSTGNVAMSMSTVQIATLEDSDNESWKSLPISQGAHLINEKNYPVSYAKIAASSLPSNSANVTGNSSIISGNDDGGGGGSCSSGSGGSTSSDGVMDEKNVDEDSTKDSNMSIDSNHSKIGCTVSESGKDDKYLLRDNYGNKCMNRRHSIGECVGSQDAAIESVADTKQEISRSQHLLSGKDGACHDINTECQIYFCDRKSVTSGDEMVGKLSLKDRSPSSSIETLTPSAADAETKILGECQKIVSNTSATTQHNQSCNSSSSSISSHSGAGDDALAVKFVNPRDRRHNDKQFKITFGFFCDTDARNMPQGNAGSEEGLTPSDISLPSSNLSPPLLPSTSPKLLEMFAAPPLQQNFEISNRVRDTLDKTSEESEDDPPVSDSQNTDFVTDGSKKDNNKATTANATSISSSSSSSSFSSSAPDGAICDLVKKDVKPVDVDIQSANKLNGLVFPFGDKTCLTPSSSVAPVSKQAVVTTNAIIVSTTTTSTTKKSITSPAKTMSTTASPNNLSGARDSYQLVKLVTSNSVTDKSTAASTTTSTNSAASGSSSYTNNNNASAAVVNAADSNVHEEFGLIPLSYGNKIKADNKKVIHFRSDDADAQLFNQEEVLSYLSKEYHRVCQLSGPSTIVRVGTE